MNNHRETASYSGGHDLRELFVSLVMKPDMPARRTGDQILSGDATQVADALGHLTWLLGERDLPRATDQWEKVFTVLHGWLMVHADEENRFVFCEPMRAAVVELYRALTRDCPRRYCLLALLSLSGTTEDMVVLAQLFVDDPPASNEAVAAVLVPLLHPDSNARHLFPHVTPCLTCPPLAVPLLDVANYLCRHQPSEGHPLAGSVKQLVRHLGALTAELESIQASLQDVATPPHESTAGAIALVIALCDALALIGDPRAIPVLSSVLQLRHRRLWVESAAALARFGEDAGTQALISAARDPVTRLRALQYARELSLEGHIDEQFQSHVAVAEAQLMSHLGQSTVMGVAPTSCTLVDQRTLFWPGYDEPRDCFLFRYDYQAVSDGQLLTYNNLGIAGPLVAAHRVDLQHLVIEDVYAFYAGWYAEHPEITQRELPNGRPLDGSVRDAMRHLETEGFESIRPVLIGYFFGDQLLVAAAIRGEQPGTVVSDGRHSMWLPMRGGVNDLGVEDIYCIYKGRRLLTQFNMPDQFAVAE